MSHHTTEPLLIQEIPASNPQAVLILLHGLGGNSNDLIPLAHDLVKITKLDLHIILPQAPSLAVTINQGLVMPAWYDINSLHKSGHVDYNGIAQSVAKIWQLIAGLQHNTALKQKKLILGGFSQGAVISLATMLSYPGELNAILSLSGYLPFDNIALAEHATPIFMAHGTLDDVVAYDAGYNAYSALKKANYAVTLQQYNMAHTICRAEIKDLGQWLMQHLNT